jgi:hypothetical protein
MVDEKAVTVHRLLLFVCAHFLRTCLCDSIACFKSRLNTSSYIRISVETSMLPHSEFMRCVNLSELIPQTKALDAGLSNIS